MKTKGITIAQSFCALLLISLLFSTLFAALYYFQVIASFTFQILCSVIGLLAYTIGGFILGHGIPKKALLHALGCMCIILVLGLYFMNHHTLWGYGLLFAKILAFLIGSIIAANLRQSS